MISASILTVLALALVQGAAPDFLERSSPVGGGRLLKDEKCMVSSAVSAEQWGLRQASREFLIEKGLSPAYFDRHFCAISIRYEYPMVLQRNGQAEQLHGYGHARVTYKAMFEPYLTWWQHRFPVVVGDGLDKQPLVQDGVAVIDVSERAALLPDFRIAEIRTLLGPEEVRRRMQALIGSFVGPMDVNMGPLDIGSNTEKGKVRVYVSAHNENPNADSCANTERTGAIDVETGEDVINLSGACQN